MSGLGAGSCNHPGQTQVGSEVSNVQNLLPVSSRPDVGRQPNWGFKRCSPNLQDLCTDVPESPGVTCAGKRGAPTPGPRASGSELGMATTMAEGWEEGPGHMGHLGLRPKPGKSKAEKTSTRGCCRGGRKTDCPEGPPDQGNHCAAVCKCRDVSQRLRPGELGGPLGPCLGLHRQGTWCWGTGCRIWRPQLWMTRLTFSVPPSCFALPGAHLLPLPTTYLLRGQRSAVPQNWSRAWSTAGLAAHISLPCPDALLPGETPAAP